MEESDLNNKQDTGGDVNELPKNNVDGESGSGPTANTGKH